MSKITWKVFVPAAAVAALALAATAAHATTYVANRAVGTGFVDLSITTDDTIGVLAAANIVDWDITVTQGADVFSIEGPGGANNSQKLILGSALSATATDLYFDFSAGGIALAAFQAPHLGSGQTFWCVQTGACFGSPNPGEGLRGTLPLVLESHQDYSGNQIIASVGAEPPSGGVPEPAAWALMVAGFGLAGAALRRRRTFAAA